MRTNWCCQAPEGGLSALLPQVHLWEKKLALMGEVIMVWMVVQMKWMYLESIFVGSEDIANQLPREAKKFEDIDKKCLLPSHARPCHLGPTPNPNPNALF